MQKLFKISRQYVHEADKEKRQALIDSQTAQIEALGLKEQFEAGSGFVICDSDIAAEMMLKAMETRYPDCYKLYAHSAEAFLQISVPDFMKPFEKIAEKIKLLEYQVESAGKMFNEKCQQLQPSSRLHDINQTMLLEDSCTDALQEQLADGWIILAIQPQPDQRRPDYILGKKVQNPANRAER